MFFNFKLRMVLAAVVGTVALLVMGIGETLRCARTVLGPSSISYTQASTQGLAGYGYVKITGVQADLERTAIVVRQKKSGSGDVADMGWKGAYVAMMDVNDTKSAAPCALIAWMSDARSEEDLGALEEPEEDAKNELVGFVQGPYEGLDYNEQQKIAPMLRVNTRVNPCWVIEVHKPSWLKGLGFTLAGLAIPGIAVAYKMKKGFV